MNASLTTTTSITLPDIPAARLPATYEAAQKAIAECYRIDECKDWSDKAAALASYARQANDDSLRVLAVRIQDRAVRRAGELAKLIEPNPGARTDLGRSPTRGSIAEDAGMSLHRIKQAIRVANVPADDFERQVQSDDPPSVTNLANQGKKSSPRPRNHNLFHAAVHNLTDFSKFAARTDPNGVARGVTRDGDRDALLQKIAVIDAWLDQLAVALSVDP